MPIYDYRCSRCGRHFQRLFRSFAAVTDPACPECGATDVAKLPPRVRVLHSEESRLERLADPSSLGGIDENDPRSIARWAKRMGEESGEDLGDDFGETMDRLESGEGGDGEAADDDAGGLEDDA